MLLQAYDFYHLRAHNNCVLQIGGSDQWGNITAGIDLIRKKGAGDAYGLTLPLLTNADGSKFGKTVAGAVWLDPKRTSIYRFYQFWIRVDDRDVIKFLKMFTFLPKAEIEALETAHTTRPEGREAHTALARAMTDLLHGEPARLEAEKATKVLFGGGLEGLSEATFADLAGEIPAFNLPSLEPGIPLVEALVTAGLSGSKGQARKDIEGGGVAVNNQTIPRDQAQRLLTPADLLFGRHILLRKGKRNYALGSLAPV
jgi:tyrosyl-tRNA synthetase